MITFLVFLGIMITSIPLFFYCLAGDSYSDRADCAIFTAAPAVISFTVVVGMLLYLWINNMDITINKRIYEHNTLKKQYESIRSNPANTIERAAIAKDIIDYNMSLSREKWDNTTQWDYWTPDKIANLDYIK